MSDKGEMIKEEILQKTYELFDEDPIFAKQLFALLVPLVFYGTCIYLTETIQLNEG